MHSDVLPSAPQYNSDNLYPVLQSLPPESAPVDHFRLNKANEVLNFLNSEVSHYRLVAKKYKRLKTIVNFCDFSAGGVSGFLSAGGVAAAATGVGAVAALPIGSVAALFGLTAAGFAGFHKKLEPKLTKHCKITTLALSKADSVNRILSKALVDDSISDSEFRAVLDEKERYLLQKEVLRKGTVPRVSNAPPAEPIYEKIDIQKIRDEATRDERARLQKKLMGSLGDLSK